MPPRKSRLKAILVMLALCILCAGMWLVTWKLEKLPYRYCTDREIRSAESAAERIVNLNMTSEDDYAYWYPRYIEYSLVVDTQLERAVLAGLLSKEKRRAALDLLALMKSRSGDEFRRCYFVFMELLDVRGLPEDVPTRAEAMRRATQELVRKGYLAPQAP